MDLLTLIVTLGVVGLILFLVEKFVPMESNIKNILRIAVVIFVILWLLQSFGIIGSIGNHVATPSVQ